jgi:hypothetical protein
VGIVLVFLPLIIRFLTFSLFPECPSDFAQLPRFATLNNFRFGIVERECSSVVAEVDH